MSVQRETEIPEEDIQYPGIQIQQVDLFIQQTNHSRLLIVFNNQKMSQMLSLNIVFL